MPLEKFMSNWNDVNTFHILPRPGMQEINKLLKLTFIHKCRLFLIFQQTDQLVEDFSTDWGNRELTLKNIKKVKWVLLWLDCASELSSFWKTDTLGLVGGGGGGIWEAQSSI